MNNPLAPLTRKKIKAALDHDFPRCVDIVQDSKSVSVACKHGMWQVEGPDLASVYSDAQIMWLHYWADGEYDDILKQCQAFSKP